jgi:acylphosphatase
MAGVHVTISGIVQGVGFRAWAEDEALKRGLRGWVRNRSDGNVEAVFCGEPQDVKAMVTACDAGPRAALVVEVLSEDYAGPEPKRFMVLPTA